MRDQGYLESLHRPNVCLTFDRITRIEPDGVVMETGIHFFFDPEVELVSLLTRREDPPRCFNMRYRLRDCMLQFFPSDYRH